MKFNFKYIAILIIINCQLLIINSANAQTDSSKLPLSFSGYIEGYYSYNINRPEAHTAPGFIYSYNKADEFAINLGYVKASYQTENVRANLAFATGTYMSANYAAESSVFKNVLEADAGIKISKKNNLWIDAGVMPSHIGFESAVGKDNWNLSRSMLADNSPYFETGTRISYTSKNTEWYISVLLLNGWQRIEMTDGNNTPSFGHQITFKPNEKLTLNSSSFIGNDKPDSARQWRFFHDFYIQYQMSKIWGFIAGFDIGAQQKSKGSSSYNCWYSPIIVGKINISDKSAIAFRAEYYRDKNSVIINTATPNGFQTFGYSFNYDLKINSNVLWRIEARELTSKDKIFLDNTTPKKNDLFFTTSLSVSF
ncbi:MAG: porin [Arachidicoccus sp.]|nr:porin [Arachidicoccus sp.]